MRRLAITFIAFLLVSCASVGPDYKYRETIKVDPYEPDRWSHVITQRSNGRSLSEMVPKGQTLKNWKEIITFQFYAKEVDSHSVSQHLQTKERLLRRACPGIKFNVLSSNEKEALYEWSINGCIGHADQFAIARYIKTEQGIHHVGYEKKTIQKLEEEWSKWRKVIKSARVVKI